MSNDPVLVAYGGGTNSAAMLIELVRLGERVDLIPLPGIVPDIVCGCYDGD